MRFWPRDDKRKSPQQDDGGGKELLRAYAAMSIADLFQQFQTSAQGCSSSQAEERLAHYGENRITTGNRNTAWRRLREAIINPFNIVLFIIAVITFFTDVIFSSEHDYLTVVIILSLIAVSSLVAFVQSQRSNAAAENLSKMISNKADVWRDNELVELPIEEIVPGDVIKLSAGDMIPADIRFLTTKDAFLSQSALTGESAPVEKFGDRAGEGDALTDLANIGFMSSNMVSGTATALVVATGNQTYFGGMAQSLSGDRAKNSFERGVDSVSRLLIRFMIVMVPIVLLVNGLTKSNWVGALFFAVTVAVGLTPEMLPVIMTSTLAKGTVAMSGHKVIVKTLGAIQTFGEMDILCTDKTGTLTEDKIILEKYMNVLGEDDKGILRYAYLNSYYQTGLKNLMDVAIINRARTVTLTDWNCYARVDEIPFDFVRRRMSVVLQNANGERMLITKGAVEEMLSICSQVAMHGEILPLNEENRQHALATYEKHNADGLRMLAVARKKDIPAVDVFSVADETDMILIGFVGFLDPPKQSAGAAIAALKEHGVRVVVLTGDTEGVAAKVCCKVGIDAGRSLTGKEVDAMDDAALWQAVGECNLFAKLAPSQKRRVVTAFQTLGHTVAIWGMASTTRRLCTRLTWGFQSTAL